MKLHCYGSSSRGNMYILEGQNECLLIEAGIPMPQIRKAVADWSKVVGCIISHRHGDHAQSIAGVKMAGVNIYAPDDVFEYSGVSNDTPIVVEKDFKVGGFSIMPLTANHDVPCYSYLIRHKECGKLLFITDSACCNYAFTGLQNILIECNYSKDLLQQNVENGKVSHFVANRTMQTHFELGDVCEFLQTPQMLDKVKNVVLLHLSGDNSEPNNFIQAVAKASQKSVFVAQKGFKLDL